jgi:hypothetical protein
MANSLKGMVDAILPLNIMNKARINANITIQNPMYLAKNSMCFFTVILF